ncbi:MAG: FAD-binding oxidoreductase [Bacteroidota bacterium]|nr:FAD-binding oxidoreductase [Bacteroidota bacterium]
MEVDYIIVGQGIAGTMLSYYLLQQGNTVVVRDKYQPNSASYTASGIINPITGRRFVRTWMIESLMPFAENAYKTLEKELNIQIFQQTQVIDFHASTQMHLAFNSRLPEEKEYLSISYQNNQWNSAFNYPFGVGIISPVYLINLQKLLTAWRKKLQAQSLLLDTFFQLNHLQLFPESIQYKQIKAKAIIFCNGIQAAHLPYFNKLPFAPNKGEALLLNIPQLPRQFIYKQGISLVPWQDHLWWAGSSYEWSYNNHLPSETFRTKTEQQLQKWLLLPFEIKAHIAAERPATIERRPFVGLHPYFPQVGILNGLGTKGCSLAPFFANAFSKHLITREPLLPEISIHRFQKILKP